MTSPLYVEAEPAWGQEESLWEPRRAAFWLFAVLFVLGVISLISYFSGRIDAAPDTAMLALVVWLAYGAVFVLFIRWLDLLEPEPVPFVAAALAWGAVVAIPLASVGNSALASIIVKVGGVHFAQDWSAAIVGPTDEEVLKVLGVVVVILIARKQVNTVLDGIVYGALIGVGFQVVEDLTYTLRFVAEASASGGSTSDTFGLMFVLRGLAGGLYSHATYTAITGAGIAYFVVRTERPIRHRLVVAVSLFAAAWLLHFVWNSPWLNEIVTDDIYLHFFVVGFIKGFPGLLLLYLLYRFARRREVTWFDAALEGEGEAVTPEELSVLHRRATRTGACKAERLRTGQRGARRLRQLQQSQVRLAVAIVRAGNHSAPPVEAARGDVRAARQALASSPPVTPAAAR